MKKQKEKFHPCYANEYRLHCRMMDGKTRGWDIQYRSPINPEWTLMPESSYEDGSVTSIMYERLTGVHINVAEKYNTSKRRLT